MRDALLFFLAKKNGVVRRPFQRLLFDSKLRPRRKTKFLITNSDGDLIVRPRYPIKAEELSSRIQQARDISTLMIAAIDGLRANAMSVDAALGQQDKTIAQHASALTQLELRCNALSDRLEFVRQEVLFEFRSKVSGGQSNVPGSTQAHTSISKRIVNDELVKKRRTENNVRLNVGCGHVPLENYINVDIRELPGVDVVASADDLPFEDGSVTEIHSAHLLEHFPQEYLTRAVLPTWRKLLRSEGLLVAIVPDTEAMLEDFRNNAMSFEDLREVTYGLQEYEGDFHYNMFSYESLKRLLEQNGFGRTSFEFQARKNGKCRDMKIIAVAG